MFAKNFESDPPRYYTPEELYGVPSGIGLGSLYNPYLVTPPRYFAEALYPGGNLIGAFVRKEQTPYSNFTIHLMSTVDWIYWPGYEFRHWWFDGLTGTFLGTDNIVTNSLFSLQAYQMRDGGVWVLTHSATDSLYEVEQQTWTEIDGTLMQPADFGVLQISSPLVDRAADLIVLHTSDDYPYEISVYTLATKTLIRRIMLSGQPTQIMPEDDRRAYVVLSNGLLNLVDYTTGTVISTLRMPPLDAGIGVNEYLYTWDRFLRRLLVFQHRDDATDGSCLSTFSGYYPVPLAMGLTDPIPIRAPRANRATPFVCKVYGDAGEGVPGVKVTPAAGTSSINGAPPFTDSDGEAVVTLTPDAAGTDTLDLSVTV